MTKIFGAFGEWRYSNVNGYTQNTYSFTKLRLFNFIFAYYALNMI